MQEDYAALYTAMHKNDKHFSGKSLKAYTKGIAKLVHQIAPRMILDYGSGKGFQYLKHRMHEDWGGILTSALTGSSTA
jgi:hypothetical protein